MPSELHNELCERATRWLTNQNCGVVFKEGFQVATESGEQPDAIGFRSDCSILIECKASRSDFLADKNKSFRKEPELGVGDWRFYMSPPSIINVSDLPKGWGLLWAYPKKIQRIHGVPPNTNWYYGRPFLGNKTNELKLMYSALRRVNIRGHLDCIYERVG